MTFYCGIDLGARTSHLSVIDPTGKVKTSRKIGHDIALILKTLEPYRQDLKVVLEATFNWYWIVDALQDSGIDVTLAHCLGVALIRGAKVKTDRRDSLALAELHRLNAIPVAHICPREIRAPRDLLRRRLNLVELRAGEVGSIRRLLLTHGNFDQAGCAATRFRDPEFAQVLADPFVQEHARQEIERILFFEKQIADLEKKLLRASRTQSDFRRLATLPGVSDILGMTILYESTPIERFANARKYSSYCRVVPGIFQSGVVTRRRGAQSKQGNRYLKRAFHQAAFVAVRYYARPRKFFSKIREKHPTNVGKLIAYNAVAHKIAIGAFQILKKKEDYQEERIFEA